MSEGMETMDTSTVGNSYPSGAMKIHELTQNVFTRFQNVSCKTPWCYLETNDGKCVLEHECHSIEYFNTSCDKSFL